MLIWKVFSICAKCRPWKAQQWVMGVIKHPAGETGNPEPTNRRNLSLSSLSILFSLKLCYLHKFLLTTCVPRYSANQLLVDISSPYTIPFSLPTTNDGSYCRLILVAMFLCPYSFPFTLPTPRSFLSSLKYDLSSLSDGDCPLCRGFFCLSFNFPLHPLCIRTMHSIFMIFASHSAMIIRTMHSSLNIYDLCIHATIVQLN